MPRWVKAQDGARDDAKRAFGSNEQMLHIVAAVVLKHPVHGRDDGPIRQHDLKSQDLFAYHAVA